MCTVQPRRCGLLKSGGLPRKSAGVLCPTPHVFGSETSPNQALPATSSRDMFTLLTVRQPPRQTVSWTAAQMPLQETPERADEFRLISLLSQFVDESRRAETIRDVFAAACQVVRRIVPAASLPPDVG